MANTEYLESAKTWWIDLIDNRGSTAELRRCRSPEEAALHSQTYKLNSRLPRWVSLPAAATLAGLSSHLKDGDGQSLGKALGKEKDESKKPVMSETRFRQLLASRDWNEVYRYLRRALSLADGKVSFESLADTVLKWDYEFRNPENKPGKGLKFEFSKEYYETVMVYEK